MLVQVTRAIQSIQPEMVLLGGDLIDLPWPLQRLRRWVAEMPCPVAAVPGNHDRWCGLARIKKALPVTWLDEQPLQLECGLRLCGSTRQPGGSNCLLVGHHPQEVEQARQFPLMLAGHWHGCQWVAWQKAGQDYPGAWFYPYHGPSFQVGPTTLHVSRGVSDTLPIRINCPRDLLVVEID